MDKYLNKVIHNNKFVRINKNIFLTNFEIEILKNNNINYENAKNYQEIIFLIEDIIEENSDESLETISASISERNYYQNTHK